MPGGAQGFRLGGTRREAGSRLRGAAVKALASPAGLPREQDSSGISITCSMRPGREVMIATRCPRYTALSTHGVMKKDHDCRRSPQQRLDASLEGLRDTPSLFLDKNGATASLKV
jgi:hypothetical protein